MVAIDLHPHRASLLRRLAGAGNVSVVAADARHLPVIERFDRVLADVPCSGTGTLAHNPEIKWRLRAEDLTQLSSRQFEILEAAFDRVAPGGRVLYSTCSLEPEENELVVERLLAKFGTAQLVGLSRRTQNATERSGMSSLKTRTRLSPASIFARYLGSTPVRVSSPRSCRKTESRTAAAKRLIALRNSR